VRRLLAFVLVVGTTACGGGSERTYSVQQVAGALKAYGLPADIVSDLDATIPGADDVIGRMTVGDDKRIRGVIFDEQRNGNEATGGMRLQVYVLRDAKYADGWNAVKPMRDNERYARLVEANVVVIVVSARKDAARAALDDLAARD
jgi:hypothetical protein